MVPWESVLKMLVAIKDADGREYKAWGTVPRSLEDDGVERGHRIAFRAKFSRSRDDPHFGFFSRPAKARILES